jgi:hypothetical protein
VARELMACRHAEIEKGEDEADDECGEEKVS